MENSLKGKTVWITGGKRIGQEVALALAKLGANLVISYRSSEKEALEIVEKVKQYGNKIIILQADVSDEASVIGMIDEIKKEFGRLDILILLASIFKSIKIENIKESDLDTNFATHVKATFWPIQKSLEVMSPGSHIVTVSDRTAIGQIYKGYLPYVVTKSAVASLTQTLAIELGAKGIFVNSIAPGPVLCPDDLSAKEWQEIRDSSFIKYPITDEEAVKEFVDTVVRLCFVRSSGSIYPLDFGHL